MVIKMYLIGCDKILSQNKSFRVSSPNPISFRVTWKYGVSNNLFILPPPPPPKLGFQKIGRILIWWQIHESHVQYRKVDRAFHTSLPRWEIEAFKGESCAQGLHVYQRMWTPTIGKELVHYEREMLMARIYIQSL